jgi:hypothetical protein
MCMRLHDKHRIYSYIFKFDESLIHRPFKIHNKEDKIEIKFILLKIFIIETLYLYIHTIKKSQINIIQLKMKNK